MMSRKLSRYFRRRKERLLSLRPLGSGTHGKAYLLRVKRGRRTKNVVLKSLYGTSLGHSHFSDRAQMLLLANDTYNRLPNHIKSIDVLADVGREYLSVGESKEFLFLMEEANGISYFADMYALMGKEKADKEDIAKARSLARYLSIVHSKKPRHDAHLYRRRIRDTIGHGECLMGVLDTYEELPFMNKKEMALLVQLSIDHWVRMRDFHRLARVHGDFYQGNILFDNGKLTVMDRSRGEFGEPADDVTSLSINYIWYALMQKGRMEGPFHELYDAFWGEYLRVTRDRKILECVQPFFAFRTVVVCNPRFYPKVKNKVRRKLVNFALNVLKAKRFDHRKVDSYLR